jgi:hypothetical protein
MGPNTVPPVSFRVRRRLANTRVATVAIALIVALEVGAVLLVAAGAARTAAAPDTYVRHHDPGHVADLTQFEGPVALDRIEALPAVADARAITFLMAGVDPGGDAALTFAGTPIVDGRAAERPDEFVASDTFLADNGFRLGQQFTFVSLTEAQAASFGFALDAGGESAVPAGPTFTATLVGMIRQPADGDPTRPGEQLLFFPDSVLGLGDIATRSSVMRVDLTDGATVAELGEQVAALDDGANFIVSDPEPVGDPVRTSVRTMANALWIVAAVGAAAAIASLGQFVSRRVRLSDGDRRTLLAIGFTRRQVAAESVAVAAVPVAAGLVLAMVVAALGSGRFPIGFVRPLDPGGLHVDAVVLLGGGALLGFGVLGWVTATIAGARSRRAVGTSPTVERATRALPAAAATGVRFAFGRPPAAGGSARAAFVGIALVTAGIVGALTTGSSVDRLNGDARRWGRVFDVMPGDSGQTELPEQAATYLEADPDVTTLSELTFEQAQVGTATIELIAWNRLRGPETVYAVDGRIPSADDEIMLGRRTARSLGVDIGDEVALTLGGDVVSYRVTGFAPILSFGGNEGVGDGGMLTLDALRRLDPAATAGGLGVVAPPDALERITADLSLEAAGAGIAPNSVVNLRRIDAVPYLLAALLILVGAVTVGHTMLLAVRHRRRDIAVLRALGAHTRWTTSVVHTQATAFSSAAVVLGVPVGLLVGRLVFVTLADGIGVDHRPSLPLVAVAAAAASLVVLANAVTVSAAARARRVDVTRTLAGE